MACHNTPELGPSAPPALIAPMRIVTRALSTRVIDLTIPGTEYAHFLPESGEQPQTIINAADPSGNMWVFPTHGARWAYLRVAGVGVDDDEFFWYVHGWDALECGDPILATDPSKKFTPWWYPALIGYGSGALGTRTIPDVQGLPLAAQHLPSGASLVWAKDYTPTNAATSAQVQVEDRATIGVVYADDEGAPYLRVPVAGFALVSVIGVNAVPGP